MAKIDIPTPVSRSTELKQKKEALYYIKCITSSPLILENTNLKLYYGETVIIYNDTPMLIYKSIQKALDKRLIEVLEISSSQKISKIVVCPKISDKNKFKFISEI